MTQKKKWWNIRREEQLIIRRYRNDVIVYSELSPLEEEEQRYRNRHDSIMRKLAKAQSKLCDN